MLMNTQYMEQLKRDKHPAYSTLYEAILKFVIDPNYEKGLRFMEATKA